MISFLVSLMALVLGYFVYGKFVERVFSPDDRPTPAITKADGVDFMVLPGWKIFMIQFLNIAGTGPIFGAIMGAKFGPSAYLWIVFGCIFAGAMHDYLSGMVSMRNGGIGLPDVIGKYLGGRMRVSMLVLTVFLLMVVGAIFIYSPAVILSNIKGDMTFWIVVIFIYYLIATLLPIKKIIGRIYPLFAMSLLFMAVAMLVMLVVKWPTMPEIWDGIGNKAVAVNPSLKDNIFPCLFIVISCGAISGFHATQSPLMGRCMKNERLGRPIFYGAMITEGIVALIWAAIGSYFFYAAPQPGYALFPAVGNSGFSTPAPQVVNMVCMDWLGVLGGVLALLGIVAAPITTGDTALRSARLIIADFIRVEQRTVKRRLLITIPLFLFTFSLLMWQVSNPEGFGVLWQYLGWFNQCLSAITLWALTVYFVREHKMYVLTYVPALFMTVVCSTYLFVSRQLLSLPDVVGYPLGLAVTAVIMGVFAVWHAKYKKQETENNNKSL
ncbi:MAG: carbon starvation CstA family protein [Prevotella sp.]|nr:carbon starvation CstA family protein [Prevotella sp.]